VSHAYSLRPTAQSKAVVRRPYRTIVLTLTLVTSTIAVFDLYLFASSGFH
jgi:hypothetical protein